MRIQLQTSKEEFFNRKEERFDSFFAQDVIDNRILEKFWKELEDMRCNYLCPWCGMPCCGTQNCNEMYDRHGVPSTEHAKVKHSCQFHRDSAITGTKELVNDNETDRIPNKGDCPRLIQIGMKWRIKDPEKNDGSQIYVPTTYFDTTWNIKSPEDDPELGSGFFWQWFLAYVSPR